MARNLLHINQLEEFKSFLTRTGRDYRPGKGDYQVLQVKTDNDGWQVVFRKNNMPEHYSTNHRLDPLVREFQRYGKQKSLTQEDLRARSGD